MKVYSASVCRWKHDDPSIQKPIILAGSFELSSFGYFQRQTIKDLITMFTRLFVERTEPGVCQRLEHEEFLVYILKRDTGIASVVVTDKEYPQRVGYAFVRQVMDEFMDKTGGKYSTTSRDHSVAFPSLEAMLKKFQDPAEADKITRIQKDVDETKDVLVKTLDQLLERGEKIDDLVERSSDLSMASKKFYKTAKKHNQCCTIL
mmetsp:Transcript_14349/g.36601  ORF Transcript_14349/g.36601 Transcript_14349/m.36601 type:complete len:204 (+) Transcript_14349:84-695(+)